MAPITTPRASTARATSKNSSSLPNPTLPNVTASVDEPMIGTEELGATQILESKKRKRKEKPHVIHQCTFRRPMWTYFHLSLTTPIPATSSPATQYPASDPPANHSRQEPLIRDASKDIDSLTTLTLITPALTAYLGLTGSSIPIDILHTRRRDVWIRVPRGDARGVRASLMGWMGSCGADLVPGVSEGDGRVKVAWRVVAEGGSVAGVGLEDGDAGGGRELFG